jgi:DNA-binding MarR family transcriptional regulator
MATLEKNGPLGAGELAARERVQPPSMTKVIASLEEHGFVRREAHPSDKRQAIIVLTEAGHDLLMSERRSREAWLAQRLGVLTADERALLTKVIPVLDKLAEL